MIFQWNPPLGIAKEDYFEAHIEVDLWRIDDTSFRVIRAGDFIPLLIGPDYSLIANAFLDTVLHLSEGEIIIRPVTISRKATGEQWDTYSELIVHADINPENIMDKHEETNSIWQFDHRLFVSGQLKAHIENLYPDVFEFSEGFSHFGGS